MGRVYPVSPLFTPSLSWSGAEPGGSLELPFTADEEGRHALRLTTFTGPEGGRFEVDLDGAPLGCRVEGRTPDPRELDLLLGTHALAPGPHRLSFRPAGGEAGGALVLEQLRLLKLPPEAARDVMTHNEAHFVRLGIGRALYAYRLAYGVLPASLEELVASGIMPARYLTDENGVPLATRREGDALVVESTGGGWTHRLRGLDARR